MLESLLDDVPLLGEVRRKALLDHFGSVGAIRKADIAQIASIPGIGEKIAQMIHDVLPKSESIDMSTGEIRE
jgi:excinuclease ABC subunit C